MTWLVLDQTHALTKTRQVRTDAEKARGDRERFAASLDLWIYALMFDSRGVHLVSKMVCFVHRICNPYNCSVQRTFFFCFFYPLALR